jgi:signal transduction histidine kinase
VTLRTRILGLFAGFALLPVILLGVGDYLHSVRAVRVALGARTDALAVRTAHDLDAAYSRAEAESHAIAHALAELEPGERPGVEQLAGLGGTATGIRVLTDGSEEYALELLAAPPGGSCGGGALGLRAAIPGSGGAREVEVRVPFERLAWSIPSLGSQLGASGYTTIADGTTGRVLFDSRCRGIEDDAGTVAMARSDGAGDDESAAAVAEPTGRGWSHASAPAAVSGLVVAVHTHEEEVIAPFRESRLSYLGAVLAGLFIAALAFTMAARRQFSALRGLTAAADQIEVGNLRPWLPPPGSDEVGRLSLAFRNMIERLSESIRQVEVSQKLASVGELASYLSHEIRNPLSSIRLSLQSLHRDLRGGFIPSDADRIIEIALTEVKRLDGVVRTVLEMGRSRETSQGSVCSVHETLAETIEVMGPRIRAQGIELEYVPRADGELVKGNPEGLRGVWINLLVNAVDALEGVGEGRIRISTSVVRSGDGEMHVRISDNGPGVPPDLVDSIFQPFFTTKMKGNGIGLPTALKTLEQCSGQIAYEPVAAGTGAVFVVKLKLADPERPDRRAPQEPQREPALR